MDVPPNLLLFHQEERFGNLEIQTYVKEFETFVNGNSTDLSFNHESTDVNLLWNKVKDCLFKGVDQVCGWTGGGRVCHTETWWNDEVNQYIKEKHRL